MRNYILKIICSLTIISILGFCEFSIIPNKVVYAEEITNITNDEEVESKLNNLYDYINTMKSDVELINELDPISYIQSYIETGEGNLSFSTILSSWLTSISVILSPLNFFAIKLYHKLIKY